MQGWQRRVKVMELGKASSRDSSSNLESRGVEFPERSDEWRFGWSERGTANV